MKSEGGGRVCSRDRRSSDLAAQTSGMIEDADSFTYLVLFKNTAKHLCTDNFSLPAVLHQDLV
jgi:hypothetical protein